MRGRWATCALACLCSAAAAARTVDLKGQVHAFFYLWYGDPGNDGRYLHWDHYVLPHWTSNVNEEYKDQIKKYHNPDLQNVHSPFYPMRGPYSSRDPAIIKQQLLELRQYGVDVVVLSWWGRPGRAETSDTQGVNTDSLVPLILREADSLGGIKIALHLEPYPGRDVASVREDLAYVVERYASSPSLTPVYYVYDSYHTQPEEWARLLTPGGEVTVRGTPLDGVFIGLWLEAGHGADLRQAGFDGFYTYFASTGFSFGSTLSHWGRMVAFAKAEDMLSVLSVGPGYRDDKIRPWNAHNTRERNGGAYMDQMFSAAMDADPDVLSLTSYNEWGEGTQIEPAVPFECNVTWPGNATHLAIHPYTYENYQDGEPYFYLKRVQDWGDRFRRTHGVKPPKDATESGLEGRGGGAASEAVGLPGYIAIDSGDIGADQLREL